LHFHRTAVIVATTEKQSGKSMAGGKREGAGRKPGIPNKATIERQKKAAKTGLMPVDILLDIARYHHNKALKARAKRPAKAPGTAIIDPQSVSDIENEIRTEHAMAVTAADKVAPYYHPKLATLQSNVNLTGRLTLEQLVEASLPTPANSNVVAKLIEGDKVDAAE
jgi:hypothetical protein